MWGGGKGWWRLRALGWLEGVLRHLSVIRYERQSGISFAGSTA
jgi:hypothetical protein